MIAVSPKTIPCPEDDCENGQCEVMRPGEPPDGFTMWIDCECCNGEGVIDNPEFEGEEAAQ